MQGPKQREQKIGVNQFLETSLQNFEAVSVAAAESSLLQDGSLSDFGLEKNLRLDVPGGLRV